MSFASEARPKLFTTNEVRVCALQPTTESIYFHIISISEADWEIRACSNPTVNRHKSYLQLQNTYSFTLVA